MTNAANQLFSKRNIARYFAELTTIILGVLIALMVDDWRAEKQEIKLESEYLESILDETELNIENIELWIAQSGKVNANIQRFLGIHAITDSLEVTESILREIMVDNLDIRLNVSSWESIKFGGELRLIKDRVLRTALSRLYTDRYELVENRFNSLVKFRREQVLRYYIENRAGREKEFKNRKEIQSAKAYMMYRSYDHLYRSQISSLENTLNEAKIVKSQILRKLNR